MMLLMAINRWYARRCAKEPDIRAWLAEPLPKTRDQFREVDFLSVDLEMTGLDASRDKIVSVGWVKIVGGEVDLSTAEHFYINDSLNGLLDSASPSNGPANDGCGSLVESVGDSATIHHIRDADLERGDPISGVMKSFLSASRGCVLVFHHASADRQFLQKVWREKFGIPMLVPIADTLALEKQIFDREHKPIEAGALRLGACRQRYGLPEYAAHNALVDALATAELLLAIAERKEPGGCRVGRLLM